MACTYALSSRVDAVRRASEDTQSASHLLWWQLESLLLELQDAIGDAEAIAGTPVPHPTPDIRLDCYRSGRSARRSSSCSPCLCCSCRRQQHYCRGCSSRRRRSATSSRSPSGSTTTGRRSYPRSGTLRYCFAIWRRRTGWSNGRRGQARAAEVDEVADVGGLCAVSFFVAWRCADVVGGGVRACQKRAASGRRASRALERAPRPVGAPPTPSPRPKMRIFPEPSARCARISPSGQRPNSLSRAQPARRLTSWRPQRHRSTRKSSKRTAPPTDRARLHRRLPISPGSLRIGGCPRRRRSIACAAAWTRVPATTRCGFRDHRQHDAGPVAAKRLGPRRESAGRGLLPSYRRNGRLRKRLRRRGDTFTSQEDTDHPFAKKVTPYLALLSCLMFAGPIYGWTPMQAMLVERGCVLVRVRRRGGHCSNRKIGLRGADRDFIGGLLSSLLRQRRFSLPHRCLSRPPRLAKSRSYCPERATSRATCS